MKQKIIFLIILSILISNCTKYTYLLPKLRYSLTIGNTTNDIKIIQSSDYYIEIPSEYFIKKSYLYFCDVLNFRILKFNRKNEILLKFGEKLDSDNFEIENFPVFYNEKLTKFVQLGKIGVDNDYNIFVENILGSITEEHIDNSASVILKFNENGKFLSIYCRTKTNNLIYPFVGLERFSFDNENNLYAFEKNDKDWIVYKFSPDGLILNIFNSTNINEKIHINKNELTIIENIDHNSDGSFLIASINFYKTNYNFIRSEIYKITFNNKIKKLFTLKDEEYSFISVNNSDLLYFWRTSEYKNGEKITLRILNLKGKIIANKVLKLDRNSGKWFDTNIQKDNTISSIKLENNKFNIIVWE